MGMFSFKSSLRSVLQKKVFLKMSQILQEKTPVLESLLNKVACLQAWNFIKKGLQHWCFHVKFAKFLRTPILKNICQRLLL